MKNGNKYILICDNSTKDKYPWLILFEKKIIQCISIDKNLVGKNFKGLTRTFKIFPFDEYIKDDTLILLVANANCSEAINQIIKYNLKNIAVTHPVLASTYNFSVNPFYGYDKSKAISFIEKCREIFTWSIKNIDDVFNLYDCSDVRTRTMLNYIFQERIYHYRNIFDYDFPFLESEYFYQTLFPINSYYDYFCGGAYEGRDILYMNAIMGDRIKNIYAVEANDVHINKLKYFLLQSNLIHKSRIYNNFLSSSNDQNGNISIDDILSSKTIENKLIIQLDVEGSDLDVLEGAKETIAKYTPYIACACYHKTEHILEIPKLIRSFNQNYKFFLAGGCHTVCYGIPSIGEKVYKYSMSFNLPDKESYLSNFEKITKDLNKIHLFL